MQSYQTHVAYIGCHCIDERYGKTADRIINSQYSVRVSVTRTVTHAAGRTLMLISYANDLTLSKRVSQFTIMQQSY